VTREENLEALSVSVLAGTSARADLMDIALVGDTFSAVTAGIAENVLNYSPSAVDLGVKQSIAI
jgi:hypothetical protein